MIYGNLASIYRELGETDLARRFQRQVLSLQDAADAGDLLNWSADALLAGNLHLAESLAQNAWELAEDSAEISLKADLCGMLGVIAARRGELRRAVFLLIRAARGHQIDGDDHGLGVDFQNLAEVFGRMERFLWQRLSFEAAQTCFARAGRPLSTATAQRRLRDCDRLFLYRGMHPESN